MTILTPLLATTIITNVAALMSAVQANAYGTAFDITAEIILDKPEHTSVTIVSDATGSCSIQDVTPEWHMLRSAGEVISARGAITSNWFGLAVAECKSIKTLSSKPPSSPVDATTAELQSGRFDYRAVRTRGIVKEVFIDEIDPTWSYCSIVSDGIAIYTVGALRNIGFDDLRNLIDAEVAVTGVCLARDDGIRRLVGRLILIPDSNAFTVIRTPPADPFSAKPLCTDEVSGPIDVMALGRRKVFGRTIAVFGDGDALIADAANAVHKTRFADGNPPPYGSNVEVVGTPETDLYNINFSNAIWRRHDGIIPHDDHAVEASITRILTNSHGKRKIDTRFHGRAIRIAGRVVDLPSAESQRGIVTLKCGEFTVHVDVGANREILSGLSVGCMVSFAGTCVIETENWRPYMAFPHATGITLVVRTPKDITILSRPSWWTPQRLLVVVSLLILLVIVIFIWNRILQGIVTRKSRQLLKEKVSKIRTALKVDERTNLAVELHDSLSQNLSGVACQIAAVKSALRSGSGRASTHVETAERMLRSCRTALQNCLWDLRGDTLEDSDFSEAIQKTLAPIAIGVEATVRFNVNRSRLSDTTAHAIICIIRELVSNAIRHGKATHVKIAGEYHDGHLSFSVRDNGTGFDTGKYPGPAEGHFGLQGIAERVKRLNGKMKIESYPGSPTRVAIIIKAFQAQREDNDYE